MSVQEDLFDRSVTRRIFLDRYSDREARQVARFLRELQKDIKAQLAKAYDKSFTEFRLKILLRNVNDLYDDVYARIQGRMWSSFEELGGVQAEAVASQLQVAAATLEARFAQVSAKRVLAAVKARPMQGKFLRDMVAEIPKAHRDRMTAAIRISYIEGESLTRAAARVTEVTGQNSRYLKTFIRTANAHISSVAANETYKANDDIVERYEWLSVLDSRTTAICQSLDGNRYKVGSGPMPPAHFGCRSTTYPILKGLKPRKRETYSSWIKRQPVDAQNDILGPNRAKALREGADVSQFVDLTGKLYTLEELRKKSVIGGG